MFSIILKLYQCSFKCFESSTYESLPFNVFSQSILYFTVSFSLFVYFRRLIASSFTCLELYLITLYNFQCRRRLLLYGTF